MAGPPKPPPAKAKAAPAFGGAAKTPGAPTVDQKAKADAEYEELVQKHADEAMQKTIEAAKAAREADARAAAAPPTMAAVAK